MAVTTMPTIPAAGARGRKTRDDAYATLLRTLRAPKISSVAGAGANTNIAVSGLAASDVVTQVVVVDFAGSAITVLTPSAQSAGNIQLGSSTTGKVLLVFWYDVP